MERSKVKAADTIRFLFLSRFFLEFFLLRQQDQRNRGITLVLPEGVENLTGEEEKLDFGLIATLTEVGSIGFITNRMKNAMEEKPQLWTELHAAVDDFTQIVSLIFSRFDYDWTLILDWM